MRIVRSTAMLLAVSALQVASASADVSCADPDNLCTGNPCTMTNIDVQSPCTVDFGSRTLIIAGILRVPDGGTLSLTADTIIQQGPIDGRHVGNGVGNGASITLIADVGDLESRGEIDVAGTASTGSIDLQAAGNLLVKDNLVAKPAGSNITATGGTVTVAAAGTVTSDQTAVIDVQGGDGSGGSVSVAGDLGVTIQGRVHAEGNPGGTIVVGSSVGSVDLERDLRVQSADGPGGLVIVNGEAGITVNDKIRAGSEVAVGGNVQLTSGSGDVVIHDSVNVAGTSGGSIDDRCGGNGGADRASERARNRERRQHRHFGCHDLTAERPGGAFDQGRQRRADLAHRDDAPRSGGRRRRGGRQDRRRLDHAPRWRRER